VFAEVLGPNHPRTAIAARNMARTQCKSLQMTIPPHIRDPIEKERMKNRDPTVSYISVTLNPGHAAHVVLHLCHPAKPMCYTYVTLLRPCVTILYDTAGHLQCGEGGDKR
jgi:hypothetical protein